MAGGHASSSSVATPITNYTPVVIGGTINSGSVGNGDINQATSSKATGGSFGLTVMPVLMNLQQAPLPTTDLSYQAPATKQVSATPGQTFEIQAGETAGTGYSWSYVSNCHGVVAQDGGVQQANGGMMGGSGVHTWNFQVQSNAAQGDCQIAFKYARPWETNANVTPSTVNVHIA
uniref:Proteinase inhibitor I42 chagasin domain-containing protein n=1 Tax=Strombidium inclinatum TaxID=197538 RepID=A0A7S3N346_9SPIT|mmetsp:Transcript_38851/g.59054  ORF Transcript_38851/g.59054 Transcript_38851/m.59054 type:complete len:175 (+) Transcript_38851:44-568(+)|eukprot:CAMPEP_0170478892 /NCGR_PEP_ID=MMETSP0208-20121228/317_1 /TAXON_ID=197538 /ORGANISM="Strombidium inclinatum, Strain S3" /LENGTH=174 /DNA_ID=CAMNT_0010751221 /DNA_START=21 /DNA_END=545 /DNA_ORIENTATION=+